MSVLSDIADALLLGPIAPAVAANKTADEVIKGITGVWAAPSPQETGALKTFSNVNMAGASLAAAAASLGTAIPALAGGAAAAVPAAAGGASAAALPASTLASMAGVNIVPSAAAALPAAASGAAAGAAAESVVPHIISTMAPVINSVTSALPSAAGSVATAATLPPSMGGAAAAPASSVLPETSLVNSAANHIIDTFQPIQNSVLDSLPNVAKPSLIQQLAKVGQGIGNQLMSSGTQTAYPNVPPQAQRPSLPPLTNTSPLSPRSLLSNPMAPINLPPVSMPQPTMENNNILPQISGPMPPPPPPFAISDIRAKINILPGADQMDILLNNIYNKLKGSHGFSS